MTMLTIYIVVTTNDPGTNSPLWCVGLCVERGDHRGVCVFVKGGSQSLEREYRPFGNALRKAHTPKSPLPLARACAAEGTFPDRLYGTGSIDDGLFASLTF